MRMIVRLRVLSCECLHHLTNEDITAPFAVGVGGAIAQSLPLVLVGAIAIPSIQNATLPLATLAPQIPCQIQ